MKPMRFTAFCLVLLFTGFFGRALASDDDCLNLLGQLLEKPTDHRAEFRLVEGREDAQRLRQMLSHPRMASFSDREITLASIEESVEDHLWGPHISAYDSLAADYGVYVGRELVGTVRLTYYPKHKEAAIAYAISPDQQRRGLATEATRAMVEFAFNDLEVELIFAVIADSNEASIRVAKKLGFAQNGEEEGMPGYHDYHLWRKDFLDGANQ